MIVTVLLGILAMIALPMYQGLRTGAAEAALEEQLRSLAQAQRMHFIEHDVYTDDVDRLDYRPAPDLQLELRVGGGSGGGSGGSPGGGFPGGGPPGGAPPGGGPPGGWPPGGAAGGAGGGSGPADGWSGRLTDAGYGVRCAVFHGDTDPFEPAVAEGEIACDEEG